MKIAFNPYLSYSQYRNPQKTHSAPSFQASKPRKIQSMDIFKLEEELKPVWFDKEKYKAVLDKYAHIDINSRNSAGDTIVSKALREHNSFFTSLIYMEQRGEIDGIDWNQKDYRGDNLLMVGFKAGNIGWTNNNISELVKLANKGKIDVNYVNETVGYSLPQLVITRRLNAFYQLLELENLDITRIAQNSMQSEQIVQLAIKRALFSGDFEKLVCHPSMDFSQYDPQELFRYIDSAPRDYGYYSRQDYERYYDRLPLDDYNRRSYKSAIEKAVKVQNAKKMAKYYQSNGTLTLQQIIEHVNNVKDQTAINMKMSDVGLTIAHLLAELPIDSRDTRAVQQVKELIKQMRSAGCHFWQEDSLGRSPLILAFETGNLVVAKAMLETMRDSELKYIERGSLPWNAIKDKKLNHIPIIWNFISDLEPEDRKEFGNIFFECLKKRY